ncbi:MAG: hypothetical protein JW846_10905 [Dehalococcoidia bacterium]|nr:hypothetical protein [Dehalococcoidia bacterium]
MKGPSREENSARALGAQYESLCREYWAIVDERMATRMDAAALNEIETADKRLQEARAEFHRALRHWEETLTR